MNTQIKPNTKYRVITEGPETFGHYFKKGTIVIPIGLSNGFSADSPHFDFHEQGNEDNRQCLKFYDVEEIIDHLPTWCDLVPVERHQLLGELIDAMIYSGKATAEVQALVAKFRTAGYIRSVILPAETVIDEPSNDVA